MRSLRADRPSLANDLRRALDRGEIRVLFRPWCAWRTARSPGSRRCPAGAIRASASSSRATLRGRRIDRRRVELGVSALQETARELAAWQRALEVDPPIFATVARLFARCCGHDLLTDVRAALSRRYVLRGTLKLELDREAW